MIKFKEEKVELGFHPKKRKFIYSMDYQWFVNIAKLGGKGPVLMAIGLHYWANIQRKKFGDSFKLSISRLGRELGLQESTAYRAIKTLERAGFVKTEHKSGKKPLITLLLNEEALQTLGTGDSSPACTIFENRIGEEKTRTFVTGEGCP